MAIKILSNKELTLEQSNYLKTKLLEIASTDQLIGGLLNNQNIHPLILNNGVINIIKFFDNITPEKQNFIWKIHNKLKNTNSLIGLNYINKSDKQIWTCRTLYSKTLRHLIEFYEVRSQLVFDIDFIKQLFNQVQKLKNEKVIHGHLNLNNIIYENKKIFFVDFLYSIFNKRTQSKYLDPARKNNNFGFYNDIYSLGLVLNEIPINYSEKQNKLISLMIQENFGKRPTINYLIKEFFTEQNNFKIEHSEVEQINFNPEIDNTLNSKVEFDNNVDLGNYLEKLKDTAEISPEIINNIRTSYSSYVKSNKNETTSNTETIIETTNASVNKTNKNYFKLFKYIFLASLIGIFFFIFLKQNNSNISEYKELWNSGIKSNIEKISTLALEGDSDAQNAIISSSINNNQKEYNSQFIKNIFQSKWEPELTKTDRKYALSLGLAGYIENDKLFIPNNDEKLHPGLVYSILNNSKKDHSFLKNYPISYFNSLSKNIALSFAKYEILGFKTLSDKGVKELAKLSSGNLDKQSINNFFNKNDSNEQTVGKLNILNDLEFENKNFHQDLYNHIKEIDTFSLYIKWFDQSKIFKWDEVEPSLKLNILSGQITEELSEEYLFDLLDYPLSSVRISALNKLISLHEPSDSYTLNLLKSPNFKLFRDQKILLGTLLKMNVSQKRVLIDSLFSSNPDIYSLVQLLVTRVGSKENDLISIEIGRYLKDKVWFASLTDYENLINHPNSFIRALIYEKLNKSKDKELSILKKAFNLETNQKLKDFINKKIS